MAAALSPTIMRRIITLALLVLTATAGSAMADRRDHGRGHDRRPVVRDHRNNHVQPRTHVQPRREFRRDRREYRYSDRRAVRVNNGRFVFNNGYSRSYTRPFIQYRYTNYRVRPQILVENYDNVPGYTWTAGQWQWNGYEWNWIAGHYDVDHSYQYSNYDSGYENSDYQNIQAPDTSEHDCGNTY